MQSFNSLYRIISQTGLQGCVANQIYRDLIDYGTVINIMSCLLLILIIIIYFIYILKLLFSIILI